MSHRARRARPRSFRPILEVLESRNLLSASTALVQPDVPVSPEPAATPSLTATPLSSSGGNIYYTPQEIRTAYGINQAVLPNGQPATGAGQTIAIVDAYHDPNIAADLAAFDAAYGLAAPPSFQQVQLGGVTQVNSSWASETALDVEWAHAVAPGANILLVEAPSANYSDLLSGVQYAAAQPGVVAVSMSWGGSEFYNETALDSTFTTPAGHAGVTFVASSGDAGAWHGPQWPAVSPNVLAVGGTSLYLTSQGSYSSESAWSGSGGGYSAYEREPSFQASAQYSGRRTSPDVAYNADPSTGFVVRNTVGLQAGQTGWWISGGTSAGAPQWAGIIALADQARAAGGLGSLANGQKSVYALSSSDFHDVTTGSNGYAAVTGYDLATGRGTPYVNRIVADLARVPGAASPSASSATLAASAPGRAQGLDVAFALPGGEANLASSMAFATHEVFTTQTTAGTLGSENGFTEAAAFVTITQISGIAVLPNQQAAAVFPTSGPAADLVFNSLGVTHRDNPADMGPLSTESVTEDLARGMLHSRTAEAASAEEAGSLD